MHNTFLYNLPKNGRQNENKPCSGSFTDVITVISLKY